MSLNIEELLTGTARRVAHVTRFAGTPLHRTESVAEHSYMTAQYALFIGWECQRLGGAVHMERLLARALVHDLDEAVMVDLPRPIKYADAALREAWQVMCHRAIKDMEKAIGLPFFHTWLDAKDDSLEGAILALADLIAVTSYVLEELAFGNTYMLDVLRGNIRYLETYRDKTHTPNELRVMVIDVIRFARRRIPDIGVTCAACGSELTSVATPQGNVRICRTCLEREHGIKPDEPITVSVLAPFDPGDDPSCHLRLT